MGSAYGYVVFAMISIAAGVATFVAQLADLFPILGSVSPTAIGFASALLFIPAALRVAKKTEDEE